jgi:phosphoesterase RecJ-like protein
MALEDIAKIINENKSFILLPHVSADGDSIGSSTGLSLALKKLGKKATILLEEEPPSVFKFLPGFENLKVYNEGDKYSADCVIALDTGDIKRLGNRYPVFEACSNTINIDHHQTNTNFAAVNYIDVNAAAVAEIMWDLAGLLKVEMDTDIASCLYTSIMTDTGGFRFSNTTSKTHDIAGRIIDLGVNIDKIASNVLESNSVAKLKLIGAVLNTLELHYNNKLAILTVTSDMIEKVNATEEDSEGLVNYAKGIIGTEVGILLKETPNGIRVNFRSKEYVDVAEIAVVLGGGGHKKAAGCTLEMSLEAARAKILDMFKDVFVK